MTASTKLKCYILGHYPRHVAGRLGHAIKRLLPPPPPVDIIVAFFYFT